MSKQLAKKGIFIDQSRRPLKAFPMYTHNTYIFSFLTATTSSTTITPQLLLQQHHKSHPALCADFNFTYKLRVTNQSSLRHLDRPTARRTLPFSFLQNKINFQKFIAKFQNLKFFVVQTASQKKPSSAGLLLCCYGRHR